jgi:hypothetical protein
MGLIIPGSGGFRRSTLSGLIDSTGLGSVGLATVGDDTPPVALTKLNSADKAASVQLSNNDLTATKTGANGQASVRSTIGKTTGKWVYKVTINTWGDPTQAGCGFANAAYVLSTYLGASVNDVSFNLDDNIWYNSGDRGTWTSLAGADLTPPLSFFLAFDVDATDARVSFNGTDWSAAIDAFDILVSNNTIYAAVQLFTTGDSVTVDFIPTGWTLSGYSNWG